MTHSRPPVHPTHVPAPRAPLTLLCIQGDLAALPQVERALERWGPLRTLFAQCGRLGMELAGAHAPDLIVLDPGPADLPVAEVLRSLRENERTRGIPVVVLAATLLPDTVAQLLEAGASSVLLRPADPIAFDVALERFLPARAVPA